jgi:hypothetical protein
LGAFGHPAETKKTLNLFFGFYIFQNILFITLYKKKREVVNLFFFLFKFAGFAKSNNIHILRNIYGLLLLLYYYYKKLTKIIFKNMLIYIFISL